MYEVEQKFPTSDLAAIEARLTALGATWSKPRVQVDRYYAHPERDFAATDEALRIRSVGDSRRITYKGPKIDSATKTRREIELPLATPSEPGSGWEDLLEVLGFRPVAEVRKRRRQAVVAWRERRVAVCLDEVENLGTFVELELQAEEDQLDSARACIASLADALGLVASERRSYLELLKGRGGG